MNELKPCPCCGGTAELKEIGNNGTRKRSIVIKCKSCFLQRTDAGIRSSMEVLRGYAIKAWNERTPPTYAEGQPCSHPGCLHHVTHPCEGCGRTAGKNPPTYAQGQEEMRERAAGKVWAAMKHGGITDAGQICKHIRALPIKEGV